MQLNEYLNSDSFKEYLVSPNYNKILRYVIYYDLLFNEDCSKIDELLKRIVGENIEVSFLNIVTNKLLSNNDNKKKIYNKVLSKVGNIKYEIKVTNNSSIFTELVKILSKYNIIINPRSKRVISNNLDKIIDLYPLLDNNISSIADLVIGTNNSVYSNRDYANIKSRLLTFLKEKNVSILDTTLITYYLDNYYLNSKSEIIISNNIEITKDLVEEVNKKYKNDISSFVKDLIDNKKEKKASNSIEIMSITLPYEEDIKFLESYYQTQEKIKNMQNEEIRILMEKKGILEGSLYN